MSFLSFLLLLLQSYEATRIVNYWESYSTGNLSDCLQIRLSLMCITSQQQVSLSFPLLFIYLPPFLSLSTTLLFYLYLPLILQYVHYYMTVRATQNFLLCTQFELCMYYIHSLANIDHSLSYMDCLIYINSSTPINRLSPYTNSFTQIKVHIECSITVLLYSHEQLILQLHKQLNLDRGASVSLSRYQCYYNYYLFRI